MKTFMIVGSLTMAAGGAVMAWLPNSKNKAPAASEPVLHPKLSNEAVVRGSGYVLLVCAAIMLAIEVLAS